MPRKSTKKPDLLAIGERMRKLREDAGERQEDVAPELGITQGQLSKIEAGKAAPSVAVLVGLSKRYGVSVDWILWGKE